MIRSAGDDGPLTVIRAGAMAIDMRFVPGASPEVPEETRRRSGPPDNEVPGLAGVSAVLARTEDMVVALTGARAYSTGVMLELAVRRRRDAPPEEPDLHELVNGGRWHGAPWSRAGSGLLLGVQLADGRTATILDGPPGVASWLGVASGEPVLAPTGGGGGGRRWDQSYWLTPLPVGDLVVVCAWVAAGIPETRTVIDGGPLAEAARRAVVLWPQEPERCYQSEPPAQLELPAGGWFEQAVRRRGAG